MAIKIRTASNDVSAIIKGKAADKLLKVITATNDVREITKFCKPGIRGFIMLQDQKYIVDKYTEIILFKDYCFYIHSEK